MNKRVELHIETKMGGRSLIDPNEIVNKMEDFGHDTFGIVDIDVIHSFPVLYNSLKNKDNMKAIYGCNFTTTLDNPLSLPLPQYWKNKTFVVFDIETTGLSPRNDEIIEIGAIKMCGDKEIDSFQTFVKPLEAIPKNIENLTGINDDMVANASDISEVLPKFIEFIGNGILVAHNADFDCSFIKNKCIENYIKPPVNNVLDTLGFARDVLPKLKNHKLGTLVKYFETNLENHHRAVDDSRATADVLLNLLKLQKPLQGYQTLVYIKNNKGRKTMNELVSKAHIDYLNTEDKTPQIPQNELLRERKNLLIGSEGMYGEVFLTLISEGIEKAKEIAKKYDFIEVYPPSSYQDFINHFIIEDIKQVRKYIETIIKITKELDIPVIASSNPRYFKPSEKSVYEVFLLEKEKHLTHANDNFMMTTEEMLNQFSFLSNETANEIVIINTNKIADMIEKVNILPDHLLLPGIEQARKKLELVAKFQLCRIYGDNPDPIILDRITKEKEQIFGLSENSKINYAVLYWIAFQAVSKARKDGEIVGSRGSVGSSFLAFLLGISEVNPLSPHYVCPICKHVEFVEDVENGLDLPEKQCPTCKKKQIMIGDGNNIPFESFVGLGRVKPPDIDLNFSSKYQLVVHDYVRELFGDNRVFRAGTLNNIGEKNVENAVENMINKDITKNPFSKIALKKYYGSMQGVKTTTGQHAGGLVIFPQEIGPLEWTPLQYSANNPKKPITTHFDYKNTEEVFVKIDLLGQDTPTIAKMYQEAGIKYEDIPINDEKIIKTYFSNAQTAGISEFQTNFVQELLKTYKPRNFNDLVRICGLSHGTDVWFNNAKDLIEKGTVDSNEVIACRDDIMLYLIKQGLDDKTAYQITERVRKGRGLEREHIELMKKVNVPDWYIQSCQKIKYLFPKAHAVAYTLASVKQAWMKFYHPEVFYATYFSVNSKFWDWDVIAGGKKSIEKEIKKLEKKGYGKHMEDEDIVAEDGEFRVDDKKKLYLLQAVHEALSRSIKIGKVNIQRSLASRFIIDQNNFLLPPFVTVKNIGEKTADDVVKAREEKPLIVEELRDGRACKDKKIRKIINKRAFENLMKYSNSERR